MGGLNAHVQGLDGNDSLIGSDDDDVLDGGAGGDTLEGRKGNDSLIGGTGSDAYVYARGDGMDTITDVDSSHDGYDVLVFQPGIEVGDVTVTRTATQIVLSLDATNSVAIDWDGSQGIGIEGFTVA